MFRVLRKSINLLDRSVPALLVLLFAAGLLGLYGPDTVPHALRHGWSAKMSQTDSRPWSAALLVRNVQAQVRRDPIVILGASEYFHGNLLQFESGLQGTPRHWTGFNYQAAPVMNAGKLLAYLDQVNPGGVVYKTPPYYLMLGDYVPEAVEHLIAKGYVGATLPHTMPDGSMFVLYLPPAER